jgi:DNA polymerase-4
VRTILHVDLDAFYASVEVLDNPDLAGRPVLVGGTGPRSVVAAASYEARRFGCHSAMPMARARRLCPQAVVLPPRFDRYGELSRRIHEVFHDITPLVEPIALDEAFLDVSGAKALFGSGAAIGSEIRTRIREQMGLTASVGVSTTKLIAKLASDSAKPDGLLVIPPGKELTFLHPLPVRRLWGVGPATFARLSRFGVETVGDLAAVPEATLIGALGKAAGHHLHQMAHNRDDRPVEPDRELKSVGVEETFPTDVSDRDTLRRELQRQAGKVGPRLRQKQLAGRTVTIKARYADFRTITRSVTVPDPFSADTDIARLATSLLDKIELGSGLRLLGVSVKGLGPPPATQSTLPFEEGPSPKRSIDQVQAAVDQVRARFGPEAIR